MQTESQRCAKGEGAQNYVLDYITQKLGLRKGLCVRDLLWSQGAEMRSETGLECRKADPRMCYPNVYQYG